MARMTRWLAYCTHSNRILGKEIKSTQQEIVAWNSKQNTPGPLERTNLKHKRKKQIIFDAFYKI